MLVKLPHESVTCVRRVSLQLIHDVILHEGDPVFVLVEHAGALVWHDLLQADDQNVGQVFRALHIWKKPGAKVLLLVGLHSAKVP